MAEPSPQQHERWLKIGLYLTLALVVAWVYFSSSRAVAPPDKSPAEKTSTNTRQKPARDGPKTSQQRVPTDLPRQTETPRNEDRDERGEADEALIVRNARVVDESGRVIHRGEVDLRPTIERIERGERLRFSHDGSVFENRERRLPNKPRGYYREFIHPTPDEDGPGGQRVVIGREGETYYTPDHYKTFRRVR